MACASALFWTIGFLAVGVSNLVWSGYGDEFLDVLGSIYPGYDALPTLSSVLVGAGYALFDGAVAGALLAWLYNLCLGCKKCCDPS